MVESVDVVGAAIRRRRMLQDEMEKLDGFLQMCAELSGLPVNHLLDQWQGTPSSTTTVNAGVRESEETEAGLPQREFTEAVREVLLGHGEPMNSRQLLEALRRVNKPVGGSDELKNLTTKLWRARMEILKVDNSRYWLADRPTPSKSALGEALRIRARHTLEADRALTPAQTVPERLSKPSWGTPADNADDDIPP